MIPRVVERGLRPPGSAAARASPMIAGRARLDPCRGLRYPRPSMGFRLQAPYTPAGDQPQAIAELVAGLRAGERHQTLLGVTGSGKTYTIANVLAQVGRPTLVIPHN